MTTHFRYRVHARLQCDGLHREVLWLMLLLTIPVFGSVAVSAWAQTLTGSHPSGKRIQIPGPKIIPGNFVDEIRTSDIHFKNEASHTSRKYLIETMGSGVALFDYDNDGRLDIYFVNGAPLSDPTPRGTIPQKTEPKYWNRLYRNNGDGTFTDVTEKAGLQGVGYGMGVAAGDYDNDGL